VQMKIFHYETDYKEMSSDEAVSDEERQTYKYWKYFFVFLIVACFALKLLFCYGNFWCYRKCEKLKLVQAERFQEVVDMTRFETQEHEKGVMSDEWNEV